MNNPFFVRLKMPIHNFEVGELVKVFTANNRLVLASDFDAVNQRIIPFHLADLI
jgi:hypothetical protein